jgi:YVTN family beta-propeller protein
MYSNKSNRSRAAWARGFGALFAMLAMGLGLPPLPAAAAPFAYVANSFSANGGPGTVSVIDTATNTVVATVPVGVQPEGVAVTPDGKHAYVTNFTGLAIGTVSVIDTATNTVVATVPVGYGPTGVAVTPDGKHAYVANNFGNFIPNFGTVSVIATATNTVVATVPVGEQPQGIAITPDGKHAYVANSRFNFTPPGTVSVIATASNTVVGSPIPAGLAPFGIAITPDGTKAYVTDYGNNIVEEIDTSTNTGVTTVTVGSNPQGVAVVPSGIIAYVTNASSNTVSAIFTGNNTIVGTIPVGTNPIGVSVTPDGKHVFVANYLDNTVSVIDRLTNAIVATIPVGNAPYGVAITPPPPGLPFLAFYAQLVIQFGSIPNKDAFGFGSDFTLSRTAPAINPLTEPVTLQVGTFAITIPAGSFGEQKDGSFAFKRVIDGVILQALIKQKGTLRYTFQAKATGANLTGTTNTVYATLTIGGNSGAASVTAGISN